MTRTSIESIRPDAVDRRWIAPVGQARNDFAIFVDLADRLGCREAFTEGRTEMESVRHLYEAARGRAARKEMHWPDFYEFWEQGYLELPADAQARRASARIASAGSSLRADAH